jgi:hypothetical protein
MYQANPHSANDKYSALDNVAMPNTSNPAPMGGMGMNSGGGMGGGMGGQMGGMNSSGMGGGAPAGGAFQPASF